MIGTLVNVGGILVGAGIGLTGRHQLSPERESFFKIALGVFTVYYGLRLTWLSINGSALQVAKQLLVMLLALMLGKLTGHLLRIQSLSNHIGRSARNRIEAATTTKLDPRQRAPEGFKACTALFCAAPLAIIGSVQDGLSAYFAPLVIKAVMDGLAAMGFVRLFGWGVALAAIPVLALQGTITLLCGNFLKPFLLNHSLLDPFNAVGGMLVFSVALVILGLKKIELADYLPSLVFAPVLAWIFH